VSARAHKELKRTSLSEYDILESMQREYFEFDVRCRIADGVAEKTAAVEEKAKADVARVEDEIRALKEKNRALENEIELRKAEKEWLENEGRTEIEKLNNEINELAETVNNYGMGGRAEIEWLEEKHKAVAEKLEELKKVAEERIMDSELRERLVRHFDGSIQKIVRQLGKLAENKASQP
jgi:dGTP triphosphohydrolase